MTNTRITEPRDVYTAMPAATGGSATNNLTVSGSDSGMKMKLIDQVNIIIPRDGDIDLQGSVRHQEPACAAAQGIGRRA